MSTQTPLSSPYLLPFGAGFRDAAATHRRLTPTSTHMTRFVDAAAAVRPCQLVSGNFYDFLHTEREFHVSFGDGQGKTLFSAVMTRDHRLTYWNACEYQAMLVDRSTVRRLGAGGSLPITAGDTLVVFSADAPEAEGNDQEFGDDCILDIVAAGPAVSASAIRDRIVNAVTDFTRGSRQRDDMAVLVVRYLG
jgi:serine phosphatase RsbU (regulator of sigma subunit)